MSNKWGEYGKPEAAGSESSDGLGACPFCGGKAVFMEYRRSGTGGSGMEPYTIYAGCKPCEIRFSGGDEQGWTQKLRWFDRREEAFKIAADLWNRRA